MQTTKTRLLVVSAVVAWLSAIPVMAQTFGEITGHISDPSGAAVPGAKAILTNTATNAVRVTAGAMRQLQLGLKHAF